MKTLQEVVAWLATGKPRLLLVEISGVNNESGSPLSVIRLSNQYYVTKPTDTPANTHYDPCLVGGLSFNESMSLDGTASVSYGDLEIDNMGGGKDAWLTYAWTNRDIDIYIGDLSWARQDFYKIFTGTIVDISSRSLDSLNIIISDKLQKLNVPISETELTGTLTNDNALIPVVLGECFNITPINSNTITNTLEYQVNKGTISDIIEVRDNGAPVSITKNLAAGKFNLNQSPFGQVTCSVQGHVGSYGYANTVPNIIKTIVTDSTFGTATSQFTLSDLDTSNFSSFNTTYPQKVGMLCENRENLLEVCTGLARSINAQLIATTLGKLKLVKLADPTEVRAANIVTHHTITEADIVENSLSISEKPAVRGSIKLAYCKNWSVQESGLAGGLPTSSLEIFKKQWLYYTDSVVSVNTNYRLDAQPAEEETFLLTKSDAQTIATERLNLWKVQRYVYSVECFADKMSIELGDTVTLTHSRYGLSSGKNGLVISVEKDWFNGRVSLRILV